LHVSCAGFLRERHCLCFTCGKVSWPEEPTALDALLLLPMQPLTSHGRLWRSSSQLYLVVSEWPTPQVMYGVEKSVTSTHRVWCLDCCCIYLVRHLCSSSSLNGKSTFSNALILFNCLSVCHQQNLRSALTVLPHVSATSRPGEKLAYYNSTQTNSMWFRTTQQFAEVQLNEIAVLST